MKQTLVVHHVVCTYWYLVRFGKPNSRSLVMVFSKLKFDCAPDMGYMNSSMYYTYSVAHWRLVQSIMIWHGAIHCTLRKRR